MRAIIITQENDSPHAYVTADAIKAPTAQLAAMRQDVAAVVTHTADMVKAEGHTITITIHVDGYGDILATRGRLFGRCTLSAASREDLPNRRLTRVQPVEIRRDATPEEIDAAVATVLKRELACRKARGMERADRFEVPADTAATRWLEMATPEGSWHQVTHDTTADTADDVEPTEVVVVEDTMVERDGVLEVEQVETRDDLPAVRKVPTKRGYTLVAPPREGTSPVVILEASFVDDDPSADAGDTAPDTPDTVPDAPRRGRAAGVYRYMDDDGPATEEVIVVNAAGDVWSVETTPCTPREGEGEAWEIAHYMGAYDDPDMAETVAKLARIPDADIDLLLRQHCIPSTVVHARMDHQLRVTVCRKDKAAGWTATTEIQLNRRVPAPSMIVRLASPASPVAPALPPAPADAPAAEAPTQEIPEVPPSVTTTARVVAISEGIIPRGKTFEEFTGIPAREARRTLLLRTFQNSHERRAAYVYRDSQGVHVLFREGKDIDTATRAKAMGYAGTLAA